MSLLVGERGVGGGVAPGLRFLIKANVSVRSSVMILATYFSRLCYVSIRARQTNKEVGFCRWGKPLGMAKKLSSRRNKKKKKKKGNLPRGQKSAEIIILFPPSTRPLNVLSVNYCASSGGQRVLIGWPKIHFPIFEVVFLSFFYVLIFPTWVDSIKMRRKVQFDLPLALHPINTSISALFPNENLNLSVNRAAQEWRDFGGWASPNGSM